MISVDRAQLLLQVLGMIERATQPTLYLESAQQRTIVEFAEDRKKLIDHLWTLYDNLSTELPTSENT